MASSSTSTITTSFTPGDLTTKIQDWINDPSNVNDPATILLSCLPNNKYTNAEFQSIELSLSEILLEATQYESKRILNEAILLKEQLDIVSCMGEDATYLFSGFVEHAKSFITQYNLIKSSLILSSDINQNPNYYNN